jgi:hypothetical protein
LIKRWEWYLLVAAFTSLNSWTIAAIVGLQSNTVRKTKELTISVQMILFNLTFVLVLISTNSYGSCNYIDVLMADPSSRAV